MVVLPNANGKVELPRMLEELGRRGINELHVEAGFRLNGSLVRERCVDEFLVYLNPSFLGDGAQGMLDLPAVSSLQERLSLKVLAACFLASIVLLDISKRNFPLLFDRFAARLNRSHSAGPHSRMSPLPSLSYPFALEPGRVRRSFGAGPLSDGRRPARYFPEPKP